MTTLGQFLERAEELRPKIESWRRYLHERPELSYDESQTTAFIVSELERMGYDHVQTGFGDLKTGVFAELNAAHTGPCIALRADIDALPIQEESGLQFSSQNSGVMHACGHDAHTAMLLGAAEILKGLEDDLPGRVRFIFQPGEETAYLGKSSLGEGAHSSAEFVIRSGALEGVSAVFALHVWSPLKAGVLGYALGPTMYASRRFYLTIFGRGGHGAAPHSAIDPITTACGVVDAWQKIISREVDAQETALISTGVIRGGNASNIIPDKVELAGTIRGLSIDVIEYIYGRMAEMAEHVSAAHRCRAEFGQTKTLRPVVNNPELSKLALSVAQEIFGLKQCMEIRPITGSDDYAYYGEVCPAVYFFLGMHEGEGEACPHHNARFTVNDSVLPQGAALLSGVAGKFLGFSF